MAKAKMSSEVAMLLSNLVLIRPEDTEQVSKGGIVLPEKSKDKPTRGVVVHVGEGIRAQTGQCMGSKLKPGERVMYANQYAPEIKVDGEKLLLIREEDVYAILN
jgi:chaperonin GroES